MLAITRAINKWRSSPGIGPLSRTFCLIKLFHSTQEIGLFSLVNRCYYFLDLSFHYDIDLGFRLWRALMRVVFGVNFTLFDVQFESKFSIDIDFVYCFIYTSLEVFFSSDWRFPFSSMSKWFCYIYVLFTVTGMLT